VFDCAGMITVRYRVQCAMCAMARNGDAVIICTGPTREANGWLAGAGAAPADGSDGSVRARRVGAIGRVGRSSVASLSLSLSSRRSVGRSDR
jgi:hypothetical protein